MATRSSAQGTVTSFDEHVGLGQVTTANGVLHPFHCTAIADGSRSIAVGSAVTFTVVPGRSGQWEAAQVAIV